MEQQHPTNESVVPKWLTWALGGGLLVLAYQLQHHVRPWVLTGTVEQQYWAHLGMNVGWIVGAVGLAVLATRSQPRVIKQSLWALVAAAGLLVLLLWFQHRHQRAVPLGNGAYQLIND